MDVKEDETFANNGNSITAASQQIETKRHRRRTKLKRRHNRRRTLFPSKSSRRDRGLAALNAFYRELKSLCDLPSSSPRGASLRWCIDGERLAKVIDEGGYESIQYQLYLSEMKQINAEATTSNSIVINGLYELAKERAKSKQGPVYDDDDDDDEKESKIDVRQLLLECENDLLLKRYWTEPEREENLAQFNAISRSFVEFIHVTRGGSKGVAKFLRRFPSSDSTQLEYEWRTYVDSSSNSAYWFSTLQFLHHLIRNYFKPYWHIVIAMIFLSCCDVVALLGVSTLVGRLFDSVDDRNETLVDVVAPAYQLIALLVVQLILSLLHVFLACSLGIRVGNAIRRRLFERLHDVTSHFFHRNNAAAIIASFSSDIDAIETVVANTLSLTFQAALLVVVSSCILFYLQWKMTLVLVAIVLLFQLPINVIARKASYHQFNRNQASARLAGVVKENVEGHRVNKVYNLAEYWSATFRQLLRSNVTPKVLASLRYTFSLQIINSLYPNFVVAAYLIAASLLIKLARLAYSQMLAIYAMSIFAATGGIVLGRSAGLLMRAASGFGRIEAYLHSDDKKTNNQLKNPVVVVVSSQPSLDIRNVSFCYHDHSTAWTLYDVSLRIPFGQSVALIGESGSGKSTLLSLLANVYAPNEGEIIVDEHRIDSLAPGEMPFGVVFQENYLFNATIRENICMGLSDVDDVELKRATKAANVDKFVSTLPLKYETIVSENGASLSGGQRQRIAFARMLIRRPKIILLDEVTSALDSASERRLFRVVKSLFRSATVIYATHRLRQAQAADVIVVMAHGRVKEMGSHDELMSDIDGAYYAMWTKEANTNDDENEEEEEDVEDGGSSLDLGLTPRRSGSPRHSSIASERALSTVLEPLAKPLERRRHSLPQIGRIRSDSALETRTSSPLPSSSRRQSVSPLAGSPPLRRFSSTPELGSGSQWSESTKPAVVVSPLCANVSEL